jgi:hypothetical protein
VLSFELASARWHKARTPAAPPAPLPAPFTPGTVLGAGVGTGLSESGAGVSGVTQPQPVRESKQMKNALSNSKQIKK